jgi:hypothetical protein
LDIPGLCIIVSPTFNKAAAQALCIELLEAAAVITPFSVDGCIVTITIYTD